MDQQQHLPALASMLQRAVGGASNTTLEDRQAAEEQLRVWSENEGFCRLLLTLASTTDNNADNSAIRVVAMIYLKNLTNRAWRARGQRVKALADHDKQWLRDSLFSALVNEPIDAVAAQGVLVTAKIARNDWPQNWPSLFSFITQNLDSACSVNDPAESLRVFRTLSVLSAVVKELASKPLPRDRRNVQELASNLFVGVQTVWDAQAHQLVDRIANFSASSAQGQTIDAMIARQTIIVAESLLKTTKAAALLLKHSNSKLIVENPAVQTFLASTLSLLERASDTRALETHPTPQAGAIVRRPLRQVVDKIVTKIAWMLKQVMEVHADATAPFLGDVLRVASSIVTLPRTASVGILNNNNTNSADVSIYANSSTGGHASATGVSDKCALWCIRILSKAVSATTEESTAQGQAAAQFFTPVVLEALCCVVVCHYIGPQALDLTEWEEDPESFAATEAATDRERDVRAAVQDLFLAAVDSHTELVCKWLASCLTQEEHMHGPAFRVVDSDPCVSCKSGLATLASTGVNMCTACSTANGNSTSISAASQARGTLIVSHHVVMREALYLCVGIAGYAMQDYLSFSDLIAHSVLPLLASSSDAANNNVNANSHRDWQRRVLLRRSLWLVGCSLSFVSPADQGTGTADVATSASVRSQVYVATANVMGKPGNDVAVRLAACDAMVSMIENDWAKDWQGLAQVQPLAIEAACALLRAEGLGSARQQVGTLLLSLVTTLKRASRPFVSHYLSPIPWLWECCSDSSEQSMMRTLLLRILDELLRCALHDDDDSDDSNNNNSSTNTSNADVLGAFEPVLLPILGYSTDATQPEHLYLAEDALRLWLDVVCLTPVYLPVLDQLFPRAPAMLQLSVESLKDAMELVRGYVLLGGSQFMDTHHTSVRDILLTAISEAKPSVVNPVIVTIEVVLCKFPQAGPALLEPVLAHMLMCCVKAWRYKRGFDAGRETNGSSGGFIEPDVVVAGYLTVLARAAYAASESMVNLCNRVSVELSNSGAPAQVQVALVDLWVEMLDTAESFTSTLLDGIARRRLWICAALALPGSTLQSTNAALLPGMVAGLMSAVAQVANETSGQEETERANGSGSDGEARLDVLRSEDGALRCDVRQSVQGWVTRFRQSVGDNVLAQELNQVDPVVRTVLDALMR